ncbi:RNA-directed DNA polymerase, eukaryota, reverse transcriptase zinc-binding domain protein [Tanacetum coccineum]
MERNRKVAALEELSSIGKKINEGSASPSDTENRLNLLHELEIIDKFASMDLIQKARVKWDIEGDENTKFFHGMDQDYLERLVTHEEIKEAVWDCGSSKAPSPDGFSFAFVKKYRDIIKKDLHDFINSFFASCDMPYGANSSFFTLIPKVNNPTLITDFRPISLIGIHYKIIAKILANRLSKVIDKIVSKEQSSFIAGHQILDGPIILNHILDSLGFGIKWRSWIKTCLSSSRASILVNDSPTFEFSINRGLRQGDPISPFLFILVMEGLNNAFADAVGNGLINDLENILRVLHVFYLASGPKINIHKSNIYGIGVNEDEVYNMASNARCIAVLKLLTLLFSKNGVEGCSLLQMIYGLKSLKLFMVMKVVLIIMAAVSRVVELVYVFERYNGGYMVDASLLYQDGLAEVPSNDRQVLWTMVEMLCFQKHLSVRLLPRGCVRGFFKNQPWE